MGEVISVVTSAMMTSIANSVGEITAEVEADVQHDQLHQAPRVHQNAERRASPATEVPSSRAATHGSAELSDGRHQDDQRRR